MPPATGAAGGRAGQSRTGPLNDRHTTPRAAAGRGGLPMNSSNGRRPRKVLLAEFNEVTWRIIRPLCERGVLPTFSEFLREGASGSPLATEDHPELDPWIAWTTVHTGRPQEEHGVRFLEQPPETVTGPRIADLAADAGKSV